MRARAPLAAVCVALACAVLGACSQTPRTQVILVVDSDIRGADGINGIGIAVTSPSGEVQRSMASLAAGQPPLPRTLGLVLEDDATRFGPYTVNVSGTRSGTPLVVRTLRFSFVHRQTLMLRVDLLQSCRGTTCGAEQSCDASGCRSIDVAASELEPWRGTPPSRFDGPGNDAGMPMTSDAGTAMPDAAVPDAAMPEDAAVVADAGAADACAPMAETCNEADDDCDGMVDEDFDLDTDEANCGSCGNLCELPNASAACMGGACVIASCDADFDDCNTMDGDGCEADLTSIDTCGNCATRCIGGRMCCMGTLTCMRTCP